jgi:hypothetical protein
MFGCPFKPIWEFIGFFVFLAINQNIDTQLYIYAKNYHCHMDYFKFYSKKNHLNLFKVNVICKK